MGNGYGSLVCMMYNQIYVGGGGCICEWVICGHLDDGSDPN